MGASTVLDPAAVVASLATYVVAIVPRVRRQLRAWEQTARLIPDPVLRERALATLANKATNAEAVAVFGILAPRSHRTQVVALIVAFQVLTDFLDTLSEEPCADPLRNGLELHRALTDVLCPSGDADYYRHHPRGDDGGYVEQLVLSCRERFATLPRCAEVRTTALRAARRCGEGQSYTHAAIHGGRDRLEAWSRSVPHADGYGWWEIAAGASSSVAIHALLAAAADPRTTSAQAELVDAAYFPSTGALTVLLDNLVDFEGDVANDTHNYLLYYPSSSRIVQRLVAITVEAQTSARRLRHHRRHGAIVTGVVGFYLSAAEGRSRVASIAARVQAEVGGSLWAILAVMRARRRCSRSTSGS